MTRAVKANPLGLLVTAITIGHGPRHPVHFKHGSHVGRGKELQEQTRAANLEIATQIGLLRKALNLDVNMASVKELRDGVAQINAQLEAFNTKAVTSKVSVEFDDRGFIGVKDIDKIGDDLSPLLKKELGEKLQGRIKRPHRRRPQTRFVR